MKKNLFKSITFPKNKSLNTFLTDNKGAITAGDIKVKLLQREMNGEKRKTLRQSDWKLSTKTVWRSCWVRWEGWLGKRFKAKWWGKRTDWISLVCVSTGFAWRPAQHHPAQPPEQFTSSPLRLTVWLWHTKSQKTRARQLQSDTHLHLSLTSLSPNLRSIRESVLLSQCEEGVTDAWHTVTVSVSARSDQKVAHQN